MSGSTQPTEPIFSEAINLGTATFGIFKIVSEHERDYIDIKTDVSQACFTTIYNGTDPYEYVSTEGEFVFPWSTGTKYYAYMETALNYYPNAADDIREVIGTVRTVELIMPNKRFYDSAKAFLRIGIAKQVLLAGTETYATMKTFDGSNNVSNQTDAFTDVSTPSQFVCYETNEDVNTGVTYGRVNGLRSYMLNELPLSSDIMTGVSFEITMTNEGRIFDYSIVAIPSNRE